MGRKAIIRRPEVGTSYLELLRMERGWTMKEVCARAHLDPVTLRRLELTGARRPNPRTLRNLSEIYGVSVARLLEEVCSFRRRYDATVAEENGEAA